MHTDGARSQQGGRVFDSQAKVSGCSLEEEDAPVTQPFMSIIFLWLRLLGCHFKLKLIVLSMRSSVAVMDAAFDWLSLVALESRVCPTLERLDDCSDMM